MKPETFDTLVFVLAFVAPGFVFHTVVASLVPIKEEEKTEIYILKSLILSVMNLALWSWLIYLMPRSPLLAESGFRRALAWGIITLVSPTLLGLLAGRVAQRSGSTRMLRMLGLHPVDAASTAWASLFSKAPEAGLLVTLRDGGKVAGVLGQRSLASVSASEGDLYLEQVYDIGQDGGWTPRPNNRGVWIRASEIALIEFFDRSTP